MVAHLATATHPDNSSSCFAHKISSMAVTNFIRTMGQPGLSDKRGRWQDESEMSNNQQTKQSAERSYCVCRGCCHGKVGSASKPSAKLSPTLYEPILASFRSLPSSFLAPCYQDYTFLLKLFCVLDTKYTNETHLSTHLSPHWSSPSPPSMPIPFATATKSHVTKVYPFRHILRSKKYMHYLCKQ